MLYLKNSDTSQDLSEYFKHYFDLCKKICWGSQTKSLEFPKGRWLLDTRKKAKESRLSDDEEEKIILNESDEMQSLKGRHPSAVNAMTTFYNMRNFIEFLFTWIDSLVTIVSEDGKSLKGAAFDKFWVHRQKYWNAWSNLQTQELSFDLNLEWQNWSFKNSCLIIPWMLLDNESLMRNTTNIFTTKELWIPVDIFLKVSETEK